MIIEGELLEEDADHFVVRIPVGTTRLLKADVRSVEKIEVQKSPAEIFGERRSEARTLEDWMALASFAGEHEMVREEWQALRQASLRVAQLGAPPEPRIQNRIQEIEAREIGRDLVLAEDAMYQGRYRQAAGMLHRAVTSYPDSTLLPEVRLLKADAYVQLLSEEETVRILNEQFRRFPVYPIDSFKNLMPGKTYQDMAAYKITNEDFNQFRAQADRLSPDYSPVVGRLLQLFQIQVEIQAAGMDEAAFGTLTGPDALNQLRANPSSFREARNANNQIYQARGACLQSNSLLADAMALMDEVMENGKRDAEIWMDRGYEKIYGEWVSGDDAKEVMGWIKVHGEWLDPRDPEFEARKTALEARHAVRKPEVKPVLVRDTVVIPPYDESELERLRSQIQNQYKGTLPAGELESAELKALRDKFERSTRDQITLSKGKKLGWPLVLGIIVVTIIVIRMAKIFFEQFANWLSGSG